MKCDKCDNEATVHDLKISGGQKVERHMCERCAAAQGMAIQTPVPVAQILTQLIQGAAQQAAAGQTGQGAQAAAGTCSACGMTFAQFRQTGMLGCPQCYAAFEGQLGPLLSRAHEGGTHHTGKLPRSAAGMARPAGAGGGGGAKAAPAVGAQQTQKAQQDAAAQMMARVVMLRKQLADAIASENYERAATLRDELQKMEASMRSVSPIAAAKEPGISRGRKPRTKGAAGDEGGSA